MLTKKDLIQALSKFEDNLEIVINAHNDVTDDVMYNCVLSKQIVLCKNDEGEKCIKLFCNGSVESDEEEDDDEDDLEEDDDLYVD